MKQKIVLIGGGGHARVLIDAVLSSGRYAIKGIIDPSLKKGSRVAQCPVLGSDEMLKKIKGVNLAIAVGTVKASEKRKHLYERNVRLGFKFPAIVHAEAYVAKTAYLGNGAQVLTGAVVNSNAEIGEDAIINTKAIVEHDCVIGPHVHVASGAILGGGVKVGECSHIGMGAKIIQGVKIGRNVTVGAGAVVTKDIKEGKTVVGIPAREKNG